MSTLPKLTVLGFLILFAIRVNAGSNFDIIANLDSGPGNVTVTDNGRIIMSLHQFYLPKYSVVEYKDKALTPFPNKELGDADSLSNLKLDSVLGIRSMPTALYGCWITACAVV